MIMKSQKGVIAPLIAAVLLGLMGLMYTLIFDNYVVAIETTKFRSKVQLLCSEVANEAPIHRAALETLQNKLTLLEDELPDWFEVLSATLTMGTMPGAYDPDNANNITNPYGDYDREATCGVGDVPYNPGGIGSTFGNKIFFEHDLCSANFKEKWGTINLSKDYNAGTFVGCEVRGRIRTFFSPREVPAGIAAREGSDAQPRTRIVYSKFGYWKHLWTDDSPMTKPQGLTIAIAPQIPSTPAFTASPAHSDQFRAYLLNRDNYDDIVINDDRFKRQSIEGWLAAPYFDSTAAASNDDNEKRELLYRLFAGSPIVLRQRISSALIELASRDGMLRSNTTVLLSNPRSEVSGAGSPDVNPPILIRNNDEDLRDVSINKFPLLFMKYQNPFSAGTYIPTDPFYGGNAIPATPTLALTQNQELSSLIARFPMLGLHLDSSVSWHQTRLSANVTGSEFPWFSLRNFHNSIIFEPTTSTPNYDWSSYGAFLSEQFSTSTPDFYDKLNQFGRVNSLSDPSKVNNLNPSQLARTLGASVKCPYQLSRGTNLCSGFEGLQPDIEGVLKAWLGIPGNDTSGLGRNNTSELPDASGGTGTRFNAVNLPGIYSNAAATNTSWHPDRPSQLVLTLHSPLNVEQLNHINNRVSSILNANNLPVYSPNIQARPITIIYIPTNNTDSSQSSIQNLMNSFHANICAPSIRSDFKRGNVLIPIVHNTDEWPYAGDPNLSCISDTIPCTREDSLNDVWNCLLSGNTPEETAKEIFDKTITRTARIF